MTIDFSESDIHAASEAAWKAVENYAKEHGVCKGCLSIAVTQDMLLHTTTHLIVEENLDDFISNLATILKGAIEAKKPNQGMNRAERRALKRKNNKS